MEKVLFELNQDQFKKEFLKFRSMTPKMMAEIGKVGGPDSYCARVVIRVASELSKNHLKMADFESAALVHNTETGEDTIKIMMNKKEVKPVVETKPDEAKEKRMDEVLQRLAGWIFTLSSGMQPFNKEDADKAIQDINYALHGSTKPPLEYQFITGAEASEQAAKVFWRVNEKVILKLLEAARFAKASMDYSNNAKGKNYTTLVEAIEEVEKHFRIKGD